MKLVATLSVALLLAGCGAGSTAGGPPTSAAANQGSGAVTTTGGPASPPPATGDPSCGVRSVVVTAREQPAPLCVHAGASLRITTEPSPHQPWSMPASSDATVLRCIGSRVLADGAVEAVCTGLRRGTATVTTSTAAFAGDPHGPPQSQWQLQVTVT